MDYDSRCGQLLPDIDLDKELKPVHKSKHENLTSNIPPSPRLVSRSQCPSLEGPTLHSLGTRSPSEIVTTILGSMGDFPTTVDEDDFTQIGLSEDLRQLSIDAHVPTRFFGRSSGAMLVQTAIDIKNEFHGFSSAKTTIFGCRRPEFWSSRPVSISSSSEFLYSDSSSLGS